MKVVTQNMIIKDIWYYGGIICNKIYKNRIKKDIEEIKRKNGIKEKAEIKWNKVSPSKINYYKELIDYFF